MTLDMEFSSTTLEGCLAEAEREVRAMWKQEIEWEVELSLRAMAKADVQAGRSKPEDWPFGIDLEPMPFEMLSAAAQQRWEEELVRQVTAKPFSAAQLERKR